MLDPLLRESPWVQEYGNEREAQGKAEGKAEANRRHIAFMVRARFPGLVDLAEERVGRIQDAEALEQVFATISMVPGEDEARHYLLTL